MKKRVVDSGLVGTLSLALSPFPSASGVAAGRDGIVPLTSLPATVTAEIISRELRIVDSSASALKWQTLDWPASGDVRPAPWRSDRQVSVIGERLIRSLPEKFRAANLGQLVAITTSGTVLATGHTFDELTSKLRIRPTIEQYYIGKVGGNAGLNLPSFSP